MEREEQIYFTQELDKSLIDCDVETDEEEPMALDLKLLREASECDIQARKELFRKGLSVAPVKESLFSVVKFRSNGTRALMAFTEQGDFCFFRLPKGIDGSGAIERARQVDYPLDISPIAQSPYYPKIKARRKKRGI